MTPTEYRSLRYGDSVTFKFSIYGTVQYTHRVDFNRVYFLTRKGHEYYMTPQQFLKGTVTGQRSDVKKRELKNKMFLPTVPSKPKVKRIFKRPRTSQVTSNEVVVNVDRQAIRNFVAKSPLISYPVECEVVEPKSVKKKSVKKKKSKKVVKSTGALKGSYNVYC